jgi:hypothetical protein
MGVTIVPIRSQLITASTATLLYTAPSLGTGPYSVVTDFYIVNASGSAVAWTLWLVPNGGTAPVLVTDVPRYYMVFENNLNAGERQTIDDKFGMLGGDTLYLFVNGSGTTAGGTAAQNS